MGAGPKNALAAERRAKRLEELLSKIDPGAMPSTKEFRLSPDGREYARRYQVWGLLAWYHHEVLERRYLSPWARLKRLWWRLTGQKVKLMSPFQQLRMRDRLEAQEQVEREFPKLLEDESGPNLVP